MTIVTMARRTWRVALLVTDQEGAAPQSDAPQSATTQQTAPAELDPARQVEARRYARQRRWLALVNLVISALLIGLLLLSGLNFWLRDTLAPVAGGWEPVAGWQP